MFHDMPLTLAQTTAPSAVNDADIRPSAPTIEAAPSTSSGTTAAPSAPATTQPQQQSGGLLNILFPVIMGVFIIYMFMGGPRKKEKKKREALMAAMKKGDKVQTIGGIIGSVVEIRDDEVVVKVDENSNTRIKFTRGAIQTILTDKTEVEETPKT